jgi:sulfur carrier protein ThiS
MKVRVRLIATYRDLLPPETKGSTVELDLPAGSRVADALTRFDVPLGPESVLLLNGLTVPPDTPLHDGDEITAFSAVAGG